MTFSASMPALSTQSGVTSPQSHDRLTDSLRPPPLPRQIGGNDIYRWLRDNNEIRECSSRQESIELATSLVNHGLLLPMVTGTHTTHFTCLLCIVTCGLTHRHNIYLVSATP